MTLVVNLDFGKWPFHKIRSVFRAALRCGVALCLLAGLAACVEKSVKNPQPPSATTEEERQGDYVFQAGNPDQAVALYDRALQSGASRASVAYRKGFAFFAKSAWAEARSSFEEAIVADPTLIVAYEGAGLSAFQLGKLDEAAARLEKTIQLAPKHWAPYAFLSAVQYERGQLVEAQKLSEQAFAIAGKERAALVQQTLTGAFHVAEGHLTKKNQPVTAPVASAGKTPKKGIVAPFVPNATAGAISTPVTTEELIPAVEDVGGAPLRRETSVERRLAPAPAAKTAPAPAAASGPVASSQSGPKEAPAAPPVPPVLSIQHVFGLADLLPPPGKEREPQATGPAQTTQTGQAGQAGQTVQDAEAAAQAKAMASATPPPGLASSRKVASGASGAPSSSGASGASYVVMESSYPTLAEAERRVTALKAKGLDANAVSVDIPGRGVWSRVLFGPFASFNDAKRARSDLAGKLGRELLILKQKSAD